MEKAVRPQQGLPRGVWSRHPWRNSKEFLDVGLGIRWDLIVQEGFSKLGNARISVFNPKEQLDFPKGWEVLQSRSCSGGGSGCSGVRAAQKSWNSRGKKPLQEQNVHRFLRKR